MIHVKNRITKLESDKKYYWDLRGIVTATLYSEKSAYVKYYVNKYITNPRILWKNIKSNAIDFNEKSLDLPSCISNPQLIKEHFLKIPGKTSFSLSTLMHFETHRCSSNMLRLKPISKLTVSKIIQSFSTNAQDIDGIFLDMTLPTSLWTLRVITNIINQPLQSGVFQHLERSDSQSIPKTNWKGREFTAHWIFKHKQHLASEATALLDVVDDVLAA